MLPDEKILFHKMSSYVYIQSQTTDFINQPCQFCEGAQWNNSSWFFCPQVLLSSPMGSWTARGQRAATKKMGPCALRAWMAASTVRMVLQRRGEIAFVCHPVCEAPGLWNICDSCRMASLSVSLSEFISKDDAAASVDASCEDHENVFRCVTSCKYS